MVGTLLEATVKTFIEDRFKLEPVAATILGNHSHDHRLGDLTADGFAARSEFTEDWLRRFVGMGEESLDPYQKVDRALVLAELRGEHALQSFERWRRQPSLWMTRCAADIPASSCGSSDELKIAGNASQPK